MLVEAGQLLRQQLLVVLLNEPAIHYSGGWTARRLISDKIPYTEKNAILNGT
jgi:hypothetical protein